MTQHAFKPILIDLLRQAQISQNTFMQELTPAERAAIGTPELWAAKDHVAHMTFWRQRLVLRLQALLRKAPQPKSEDFEELNPLIFEEQRYRSWSDIIAESDQVYADLIALADQLSEEDLTAFNRFDWMQEGMPLYTSFMGNCYEHTQNHLAQYSIRVNTIHPTGVATGMVMNEAMAALVAAEDVAVTAMQNALPIPVLMPEDIAGAVAFLVSDEAKFITGTAWPLDAGFAVR